MAVIPATQVRSIDPFDSKRFARTHNFKTRLWTNGNNYIFFPETSFIGSRASSSTVSMSPGLCVMSDVMIHITETKTFNFRDNQSDPGYLNTSVEFLDMDSTTGSIFTSIRQLANSIANLDDLEETKYLYMGVKYIYARNYPPNSAVYCITADPSKFSGALDILWLSRIDMTYVDTTVLNPVIVSVENFYSTVDDTELERTGFDPVISFDEVTLNCGVVYGVTDDGDHWESSWPGA